MDNADALNMLRQRVWNGPWDKLPGAVKNYPSMLTIEERRMLRWMTAHYFTGEGIICDLGAFIGGSTISLASGLIAARRQGKLIHSYDFFTASPRHWAKYMGDSGRSYPQDGNVMAEVADMLKDYEALITFYQGDFLKSPVPDAPIEICFVDISKTHAINDHIISEYFTKLIPGKSIVVQQDYFHFTPQWDIVTMEILKDYFEPISFCDESSAVFLNTRKLDAEAIERANSRHFTRDQFVTNIKAASKHWPYAKQKADLYEALHAVDAAHNVMSRASEVGRKMRGDEHKFTPEEVYAAFGYN